MNDVDDVFGQEALWEGDGGSSFTTDGCLIIDTALARLPKTFLTSRPDCAKLVEGLVEE